MNTATQLFKLIQITRSQPQYGYALAGIPKHELSDLAQHHYLVTFISWHLARIANASGAHIQVAKVLEFSLIHDLGELFGGDISMVYARANPKARELAKAFEAENQSFLAQYFGSDVEYFQELSHEIMDAHTDESLISKLADYVEVCHYKQYVGKLTPNDVLMSYNAMVKKIELISDTAAKSAMAKFAEDWKGEMQKEYGEFFEKSKQ